MKNNQTELFHTINQFTRHFSKRLNDSLVPLGLYTAQWAIIFQLKSNGPSTQKELSSYLGVEAPTMTRTLGRLEKAGWITRVSGKDKREKKIMLTDAALKEYPIWQNAVRFAEKQMLTDISEEEITFMLDSMKRMKKNLQI